MGRYPHHWEADVVLRDGGTAHVRPIEPGDAEALQQFHVAQSPESIYLRFFAPLPRLSNADLDRFTHVDHVDRVALVATVAGAIIGVGRYDRLHGSLDSAPDSGTAEVAFNISDAHQGRGVGSVLLEHLAAAARENGVHRFVADVLPQNRRMIGVFRDAGYQVLHRYEDGVVAVSFAIDPTAESIAVMEGREHRAEARSVQSLLSPSSVVLVGASRDARAVGHRLLTDLVAAGFTGALHAVNPEAFEVAGVISHARVADVPGPVDLAVVAVRADGVEEVVSDCAAAGVRALVVVSSGFAETGAQGRGRQERLVTLAHSHGMRVVGPNSFGVINTDPAIRLNASLAPMLPRLGTLGLFSQSGPLSVAVLEHAADRGIGVSSFVSAGNRADVSGNDCLQYWESDAATEVVALHLESLGNPRKFSRIARRLARTKPVVVVRSGTPESVAPRGALEAMFEQSGCIRVDDVRQMFDVAQLLVSGPLPDGDAVAVVANHVALGVLLGDACAARDIPVVHGPTLVPPYATAEELAAALDAAATRSDVSALVTAFIPPLGTTSTDVATAVERAAAGAGVPVVACFLGVPADTRLPVYPSPEEAVRALAAVVRYARWRRRPVGVPVSPDRMDLAAARAWVGGRGGDASGDGSETGDAGETGDAVAALLAHAGVRLWPALPAPTQDAAVAAAERVGWPVALKSTAAHLRHRADLGGVRLAIRSAAELRRQWQEMTGDTGDADLVVQAMAPAGVACVVRSVEDPRLGPVLSFGLSGDATTLLGDWSHAFPPLTDAAVSSLVRRPAAAPKLFGHRGSGPVDVAALEDVVARLSVLADTVPELAEVELNPVVVSRDGAHVLGASVRVAPAPGRGGTRRTLGA